MRNTVQLFFSSAEINDLFQRYYANTEGKSIGSYFFEKSPRFAFLKEIKRYMNTGHSVHIWDKEEVAFWGKVEKANNPAAIESIQSRIIL